MSSGHTQGFPGFHWQNFTGAEAGDASTSPRLTARTAAVSKKALQPQPCTTSSLSLNLTHRARPGFSSNSVSNQTMGWEQPAHVGRYVRVW